MLDDYIININDLVNIEIIWLQKDIHQETQKI
jgi:hypothetical protein